MSSIESWINQGKGFDELVSNGFSIQSIFDAGYDIAYWLGTGLSLSDIKDSTEYKITANDVSNSDWFGKSVAVSGNTIVVGAYGDDGYKGSAYVYDLSGNSR